MKTCDFQGRNSLLGYCTNVHPGTSPESIINRIGTDCLKVKEKINPSINFGVGLWLSAQAARGFKKNSKLKELKYACDETGIRIFSWNAFPYSDFHQAQVKEHVYYPDWSESSRLQYTLDLLEIIQELSFPVDEVSISTLPIAYKYPTPTSGQILRSVLHLIEFTKAAYKLENEKNIRVYLALEPEPFYYLERSKDVIHFFRDFLLPDGATELKRELGLTRTQAEALIFDKIRICYDTCHADVLYESPSEILKNYQAIGIKIGKVQLSSALVFHPHPGEAIEKSSSYELLTHLSSDRYLHQVVGIKPDGRFETYSDLPLALSAWKSGANILDEYRIHYHVPIFLKDFHSLQTTQNHIRELIRLSKSQTVTSHWEVETYTWSGLPGNDKAGEISDWIVEELNWVYQLSQVGLL